MAAAEEMLGWVGTGGGTLTWYYLKRRVAIREDIHQFESKLMVDLDLDLISF